MSSYPSSAVGGVPGTEPDDFFILDAPPLSSSTPAAWMTRIDSTFFLNDYSMVWNITEQEEQGPGQEGRGVEIEEEFEEHGGDGILDNHNTFSAFLEGVEEDEDRCMLFDTATSCAAFDIIMNTNTASGISTRNTAGKNNDNNNHYNERNKMVQIEEEEFDKIISSCRANDDNRDFDSLSY
jgi:hypothetical protein